MTTCVNDSKTNFSTPSSSICNHNMDLLETTGNGRAPGEISSSSSTDMQKNKSPNSSCGAVSPINNKDISDMTVSKLSANSAAEDDELYPVRTKLPVQQPDKNNFNVWSHLKNCIGKELSKISMPVQWNEPLSFLQRLSEYMNYGYLLNTATKSKDAEIRLQWVATFAVSALASNLERMGKPFNPLLGETFELRYNSLVHNLSFQMPPNYKIVTTILLVLRY